MEKVDLQTNMTALNADLLESFFETLHRLNARKGVNNIYGVGALLELQANIAYELKSKPNAIVDIVLVDNTDERITGITVKVLSNSNTDVKKYIIIINESLNDYQVVYKRDHNDIIIRKKFTNGRNQINTESWL